MPTLRLRGGTSFMTRSSKRTWPASGRSKPAIIRSVVVLPQPEPPTRLTSSPGRTSRESPSTARAAPKRFVRPRSEIRTLPRKFFLPLLHQPLLVRRIAGLHEVEIDELHVGDLEAAHRDVAARDAGATPLGVGGHRRLRHRPVEEAPGVLRILGALHQRVALEGPRHAVGGMDDVD